MIQLLSSSLLIPAHNEEAFIGEVVGGCLVYELPVLVVAHNCQDATAQVARDAGAEVLELSTSGGKGDALRTGWDHLLADPAVEWILQLDGDGQHDPTFIKCLLEQVSGDNFDESELVLGSRRPFFRESSVMPLIRRLTNIGMTSLLNVFLGLEVSDSQCGFRMVSRRFIESRHWRARHFEIETEMLLHAAKKDYRIKEVPVTTCYAEEASAIEPARDTVRWFQFLWQEFQSGRQSS